jgi:antitoxin HicB
MMRYYDVVSRRDTDGTWLLTLPAFPEAASHGLIRLKAFRNIRKALHVAIATRMQDKEALPIPLEGDPKDNFVPIPPLLLIKSALYMAIRSKGVSMGEFARMMQMTDESAARLLRVEQNSNLDILQKALGEVGVKMEVRLTGGVI